MSFGHTPDSDREKEKLHRGVGVEHNPNGPWANLKDKNLQDALVRLAGKHHTSSTVDNPKFSKFADFLDAFASAWLEQKAHVEKEAQKYGFTPCKNTMEIPAEDRRKAAVLSLTLNGSFVLLGNGCLSPNGGSGHYEKIPFRKGEGATTYDASHGVVVDGEAGMHVRLFLSSNRHPFIGNTSPLQALYYTKDTLPAKDALQLGEALSESMGHFIQTIRGDIDETIRNNPAKKPGRYDDQPNHFPQAEPELEPV